MTEVKIQTVSHHLANKLSFTFFQEYIIDFNIYSKLITIAEDSILNVYKAKTVQLAQKFDLSNEYYAIASNNLDKVAIGGDKNQVDIHTLNQEGNVFDENILGEPYLAMKFNSPVQRVQWIGKFILGYSEDSNAQLYNCETEKVIHFKPGHDGSIKNGAMDPLGEFIATSGCDGQVFIYKMKQQENDQTEVEMIKKIKITKAKLSTFDKNPLDIQWTPDGSQLLVSGESALDFESNLGVWNHEFEDQMSEQKLNEEVEQQQLNEDINVDEEMNINDDDLVQNIILSQDEEQKVVSSNQVLKSQQTQDKLKSQQNVNLQNEVSEDKQVTNKAGKSILNVKDQTTKVQQVKSKADEIIDIYPQQSFVPNCQYNFPVNKYRILAWNMVGTVCLRDEVQFTSVDVDFTNKTFHRNLVFNDDYGAQMAAINYSGLFLASKAEESDLDNYEEDEEMDVDDDEQQENDEKKRKKYAHIYYKPFSQYKSLKDWHYKLDLGENIECIAIGTNWCAVYTDLNYVRVFSGEGIQKYVFCLGTPLVSMTGYENMLSIVYHSGPSVYGCQALKIKTIDMSGKSFNIISDIECPISRYSNLTWMGYSEEGQLYTYDNEGIMRMHNPTNNQWIPAIDFRVKCPQSFSQLWIVGISEGEVLAIELPKGYSAPHLHQRSLIRRFKLKIPFLQQEKKDVDSKDLTLPQIEEELMRLQQEIDFETFRKDNWEQLKHFRSKYDNEYILSESIMTNAQIANKKKDMDKLIVNAIRLVILTHQVEFGIKDQNQGLEKVFTFMDLLHFSDSYKVCVKLCDSMNYSELAQKIGKFIQDKEQKDQMLESYKNTQNQNKSGLANRRIFKSTHNAVNFQEKPELAQFAINNTTSNVVVPKVTENNYNNIQMNNLEDQEIEKNNNTIVEDIKPQIQKTQNSNNPFLKKNSVDLNKKATNNGNTTDIFKDLSESNKAKQSSNPQVGVKRTNPFAQDNKAPSKQKKLN